MIRLLLTILLVLASAAPIRAEPVFPKGLQIGLEPAGGLKAMPGFAGFQDVERHVTVVVAELAPAAYDSLTRTIFGEGPAHASKVARESFAFSDGIGYLHTARLEENGVAMRRWILLAAPVAAGSALTKFVTLVNVTVPEAAADIYPDAVVRKMLASVTYRAPPIEERLSLIPFTLADRAGFRIVQVLPEGLLLTDGPSDDISRQPSMIVSIGRASPEQLSDRARFARDVLAAAPLRGLIIKSAEEMRIGGRPGYEIRAQAKDPHGDELAVVQWVQFVGGGFIRIIGASRTEAWDNMFNRFRAVRDGVELR